MCRCQKPIGRTSHAVTNDSPMTCRVSDSDFGVVVRARAIVTPEKALLEIVECLEGVLRNTVKTKCRFLRGSSACSCRYGQVRLLPFVDQTLKEGDCKSRVPVVSIVKFSCRTLSAPVLRRVENCQSRSRLIICDRCSTWLQEISRSYQRQRFALALAI